MDLPVHHLKVIRHHYVIVQNGVDVIVLVIAPPMYGCAAVPRPFPDRGSAYTSTHAVSSPGSRSTRWSTAPSTSFRRLSLTFDPVDGLYDIGQLLWVLFCSLLVKFGYWCNTGSTLCFESF